MIKKLRITVDGKTYEVTAEVPDEVQAPPPPSQSSVPTKDIDEGRPRIQNVEGAGDSRQAVGPTTPGDIVSPLAGRVVSIGVKPGQDVKEGDQVLTLEAMKMNTFVFAPKKGKIKEVKTEVGAAVQEGQVLLVME